MHTIANEGLHHLSCIIPSCLHFLGNSFRCSNIFSTKTKALYAFILLTVCQAASMRLPNLILRYGSQMDLASYLQVLRPPMHQTEHKLIIPSVVTQKSVFRSVVIYLRLKKVDFFHLLNGQKTITSYFPKLLKTRLRT